METTKQSAPLDKQSLKILEGLLDGEKRISYFLPIANNSYHTLKNKVEKLKESELIEIKEERQYGNKGPKIIILSITEKGKLVAEALKQAEWLSKLPPEKIEQFAQMRALIHVNMYEDHVSVQDIHLGKVRIVNVFVRPKGEIIHFYCDFHDSDDCYHVEYLFADAHLSEYIQGWLKRNGYRLAEKYEKYVEKYW